VVLHCRQSSSAAASSIGRGREPFRAGAQLELSSSSKQASKPNPWDAGQTPKAAIQPGWLSLRTLWIRLLDHCIQCVLEAAPWAHEASPPGPSSKFGVPYVALQNYIIGRQSINIPPSPSPTPSATLPLSRKHHPSHHLPTTLSQNGPVCHAPAPACRRSPLTLPPGFPRTRRVSSRTAWRRSR
jgi:hypothetical protein